MNLGRFCPGIENKEDVINFKKFSSKILKEARIKMKPPKCYLCGRETSSFCNSHCVPKFCLKSIAKDGKVKNVVSALGTNIQNDENGVNDAGTFYLICNDCDNKFFKDYETPENYDNSKPLSQKILAEITTKNYLKLIYKRLNEIYLYKKYIPNPIRQEANYLDINEYLNSFYKAKRLVEKNSSNNSFYLLYYTSLDYVVPLAFQGAINLAIDFDGRIVNDIYNYNPKYKMQYMHLCVFPMKDCTKVLLFFHDQENSRYNTFKKQFKKLKEEEKLNVISYLIFLYSEDYFFNEDLTKMVDKKYLSDISRMLPPYFSYETQSLAKEELVNNFSLSNWEDFPNILSEKFSIEKIADIK